MCTRNFSYFILQLHHNTRNDALLHHCIIAAFCTHDIQQTRCNTCDSHSEIPSRGWKGPMGL